MRCVVRHVSGSANDGYQWRCNRCGYKRSVRSGSLFSSSHLSLLQLLLFIYFYIHDSSLKHIMLYIGVANRKTMCAWAAVVRNVCTQWLYIADVNLPIGGIADNTYTPIIVEVDETKFYHRKYSVGRSKKGHWVVGGIQA